MNEDNVSKLFLETSTLVDSHRQENEKSNLLLEVLIEELQELNSDNQQKLVIQSDILQIYRNMQENLTQEEKDEFFLCYLKSIQGIADEGRSKLRNTVRKYLTEISLADKKQVYSKKLQH
ncbi:MAG: hypothetical protein RMY29_027780 [Nostoc sp. CreGUA01]|nr:hypothetical protein [Nostoc sp. CreGUA01]